MNKHSYLYKLLHLPAALLLFTLVVAYFVYDTLEAESAAIDANYKLQMREADALFNEVSQMQQKVGLVNTYYGRFQQSFQAGELASQSRVDWIDQFMVLVKNHDIRRMSLNFSARSMISPTELKPLSPMHKLIEQEQVEFEGEFQHEGDWLAFLKAVQQSINRFVLLESCQVANIAQSERMPTATEDYHFHWDRGNVGVKCQFRFLTFKLPEVKAAEAKKP